MLLLLAVEDAKGGEMRTLSQHLIKNSLQNVFTTRNWDGASAIKNIYNMYTFGLESGYKDEVTQIVKRNTPFTVRPLVSVRRLYVSTDQTGCNLPKIKCTHG